MMMMMIMMINIWHILCCLQLFVNMYKHIDSGDDNGDYDNENDDDGDDEYNVTM